MFLSVNRGDERNVSDQIGPHTKQCLHRGWVAIYKYVDPDFTVPSWWVTIDTSIPISSIGGLESEGLHGGQMESWSD